MKDSPIIPPTPNVEIPQLNEKVNFTFHPPTPPQNDTSMYRAGLETKPRVVLITTLGTLWGFGIGAFLGGRQSGLQYLAENAHKLPKTVQGWYFYHKTKNYKMMLGGVNKGLKYAGKTGGLCLLYGSLEAALDNVREESDVLNSVVAGVVSGTVFSAFTKLSKGSFRYSIVFGATFGLVTGGLSDLHRYASGHPNYISTLFGNKENKKAL